MKAHALAALVVLALTGVASAAQLYRWVDEKGRVEWRDTPPPADARNVEQRTVGGNTIQTSTLPYSVQQAMKKHPVTLWAFDCGEPCTAARNHLAKRGVPYTERNASRESAALKKLTGSLEVPVLTVGSHTLKGYLDTEWDAALDSAGYPRTPPPGMKHEAHPAQKPQPPAAKPDPAKPSTAKP
ncbi:MAG TPA: glutaredoxin family protein [Burkholderiales bacterium]|nr:glutaredoxin family protein [Burkholderiales bacterium]